MNRLLWEPIVRNALLEDLGRAGDVTSEATIPADRQATAAVMARADGVIAGIDMSLAAFTMFDATVVCEAHVADGDRVTKGDRIATVTGAARSLLTAERTCLNLLGHLSGIATTTRSVVDLVAPHGATVVDTRKTTPGLRALEKYAVKCGGGGNHRFGLDDAVLIKDNHVAVAGGISAAVNAARAHAGHLVKIEVEVDGLAQLDEALALGVDVVMLARTHARRRETSEGEGHHRSLRWHPSGHRRSHRRNRRRPPQPRLAHSLQPQPRRRPRHRHLTRNVWGSSGVGP
jgi:nicotinate-nucleotide pyrophosphorylase (carboxylating)